MDKENIEVKNTNSDKGYNRTLFIGTIIASIVLIIGVALAIFIPYYARYVPRFHTTKYDSSFITEYTELDENNSLNLRNWNGQASIGEYLSISTDMNVVKLPTDPEPQYIYYAGQSTREILPIRLRFYIKSSESVLKDVSFTITMCYSNGRKIKDIELGDYKVNYYEKNDIEIEFTNDFYNYIASIQVHYSYLPIL